MTVGLRRAVDEVQAIRYAVRSGLIGPVAPWAIPTMVRAVSGFGMLGSAITVAAARYGERTALVDERGSLTYRDLDRRSNAIARHLRERGVHAGDGVGVLVRNHRGFFDALFGAAKCGARVILLNTDFAGPQVREVNSREDVALLICDEEYLEKLGDSQPRLGRIVAWRDRPESGEADDLDAVATGGDPTRPPWPASHPSIVLLTSGTTGSPRGAARKDPRGLAVLGGVIERVPFRADRTVAVCSPMFHALGLGMAVLALEYGSRLLVRRRFDPSATWADLHGEQVDALVVVPVLLRRLLEVDGHRPEALRVVLAAGSQLGGELASWALRVLGPVVYNLYGSTEVSIATIATPADLAVAPHCVGRPVRGVTLRLVDQAGRPVPIGETGRIFVGTLDQLESYTGGGGKEMLDGLMSSGDVGHLDRDGRLFIDGRDDEMIVSGGENVYPAEIEELLNGHPGVVECALVGVPDDQYGQRLRAFVVARDDSLTEDAVRQFVRANLARFKVPRDVVFLDALPRNATGKVLKRALVSR